jgi:hypothetical protein
VAFYFSGPWVIVRARKEVFAMNQDNRDHLACGMSCTQCFRLGDTVADWPRRSECKKLDAWLRSSSENEGGIVLEAGEEEGEHQPAESVEATPPPAAK